MSPVCEMSADSFFDFCQLNSHLRIERTATGKLVIMSPAGSETGNRNFKLIPGVNYSLMRGENLSLNSSSLNAGIATDSRNCFCYAKVK